MDHLIDRLLFEAVFRLCLRVRRQRKNCGCVGPSKISTALIQRRKATEHLFVVVTDKPKWREKNLSKEMGEKSNTLFKDDKNLERYITIYF